MQQNKVSITTFIDASRPKVDGKCLIKLNVYCKPYKKRYATKHHATEEEWEKLNSKRLRDDELRKLKKKLADIVAHAYNVADKIVPFSFVAFEQAYLGKSKKKAADPSLKVCFDNYVSDLKINGQVGSAASYATTINSISKFRSNLTVHDITPTWLQSYENHLLAEGKSISTVGVYMRQLRAVINKAIEDKIALASNYPFKKYKIPAGRNIKKALSNSDLQKLLKHAPTSAAQIKALDFWILSYLCNGINFTDIAHLKSEWYDGAFLHYVREKTKRTKKKDLRPIRIALNARAIQLIEKYRDNDYKNPYLFPILEQGLNPITVKNRCRRFIKWVNDHMEEIRTELRIPHKVSTYGARHSYSTVLMRKGAPISYIKEALGHSSVAVTENYLDSFTDSTKINYANMLTDFA